MAPLAGSTHSPFFADEPSHDDVVAVFCCVTRALAVDPEHEGAIGSLALANKEAGMEQEAKAGFERAFQVNPRGAKPLYQLAEKLLDLDDALLTWRHKHAITVERVIGRKRGTGGTEGVGYLQSTLARRAFPEIWSLRTKL